MTLAADLHLVLEIKN